MHVGKNFVEDFPDRVYESRLIPSLMEANRLGEKSGSGFYSFDAKRKATPDVEGIAPFLAASRQAAQLKLHSLTGPLPALTMTDIVEMIFFPVVNEACRCLAERVVVKAGDLDCAAVLGMGFPAFRGGVVHWGDEIGAQRIASKLRHWSTLYGGIYNPCPYLEDCAVQNRRLADGPIAGPDRSKL